MFEGRLVDGASFKKIVEALRDFSEINLVCNENGIRMKVIDEYHVSLADLQLQPSFFETYHCDGECEIGLHTETLVKIIRLAPNDRSLTLHKTDDSDRLRIESAEEPETGLRRVADVALISYNGTELQIPEQLYDVEVELPTKLYAHLIKDLGAVGEELRISITSETLTFEADGERGRIENVFYRGQGAFSTTRWHYNKSDHTAPVKQVFALRFLAGFTKACPLSENVTLSMTEGLPLRLRFPLGEDSHLSFYVAPAIDHTLTPKEMSRLMPPLYHKLLSYDCGKLISTPVMILRAFLRAKTLR